MTFPCRSATIRRKNRTGGLPFEVKIPNASLKQAMDDVLNKRNLSKPYTNAKDAINAMLEDE